MALEPTKRVIEVDGRKWEVSAVIEGTGWDAEIPIRRGNWLSFESAGERRFITPLPDDWAAWSEEKLRDAFDAATKSKRRSFPS